MQVPFALVLESALSAFHSGDLQFAEQLGHAIAQADPQCFEILNMLGMIAAQTRRPLEAKVFFSRAIAVRPADDSAHVNLGRLLAESGQLEDAMRAFEKAKQIQPDSSEAHFNCGVTLSALGRPLQAIESYQKAVQSAPQDADIHWNLALSQLAVGDFRQGWAEFEWRWKREGFTRAQDRFQVPLWLGQTSLAGKTILLHSEQGLGDSIQFCRYTRLLAAMGASVILEVDRPLYALLDGLDGWSARIAPGEPRPRTDFHCPLMSLPLALKTNLATIPDDIPYIWADSAKSQSWQAKLGARQGLRVGLVWAGGFRADQPELWATHARRNIALEKLAALRCEGIQFYSLQKGQPAESELAMLLAAGWDGPAIMDHTPELADFADTAAFIDNLDLVISVDTSTAHLAGAMGKPVWILNRFDSCWRWMLERTDSPWYPTARLFRQTEPGNWDGVLAQVRLALQEIVSGPSAGAV